MIKAKIIKRMILSLMVCMFISASSLFAILGLEQLFQGIKAPLPKGTNVVFIVIDTLRADHLGVYGYSRNTSPNIDQFAKDAIVFKNAIAQSSWTPPTVASLLTGLYPKNHGVQGMRSKLAADRPFLPEILKKHGYQTYGFVANRMAGENFAFNRGYDHFETLGQSRLG